MDFSRETKFLFFGVFMPGIFALIPLIYGTNFFYPIHQLLFSDTSFSAFYLVLFLPIVYFLGIVTDDIMKWVEYVFYKAFKRQDPVYRAIFHTTKNGKSVLVPYLHSIQQAIKSSGNTRWKYGLYSDSAETKPLSNPNLQRLYKRLKTILEEKSATSLTSSFQDDKQMAYYFLRNISFLFLLLAISFLLTALPSLRLHVRQHSNFVYSHPFGISCCAFSFFLFVSCFIRALYKRRSYIIATLRSIAILHDKINYQQL